MHTKYGTKILTYRDKAMAFHYNSIMLNLSFRYNLYTINTAISAIAVSCLSRKKNSVNQCIH